MTGNQFVTTSVTPEANLDILSQYELVRLQDKSGSGLYRLFRKCALAVLNCGSELDDARQVLELFKNFDIQISQKHRGVQLDLINAPASAFVDGKIISGIRENLFAVLRDLLYVGDELELTHDELTTSESITNEIFHVLRHAKALTPGIKPNLVVCWGGHSIGREEYLYTKEVGYELGLRGFDVCTGCGPGAMKGPMKGATIAHAKQRIGNGRYVGISEPGIIAAESPNPIVNELIIMPDIEKRLEAFVRLGHGFIVFPGGAGTAEEILYILGLMLDDRNKNTALPLLFTGPESASGYWTAIDRFIADTLGEEARKYYSIVTGNPAAVARAMKKGMKQVTDHRKATSESYHFNWLLNIDYELFQNPFEPTHENMAELNLSKDQPVHELAANLRSALSGIVSGNVKESGIQAIETHGPFKLTGDPELMKSLDAMLRSFVDQRRMKLNHEKYEPCYRIQL
ncbi:nucleotide 5'-monophosphate nucleosidase PpnN [Motiliproteus sp. MSK22-1]|uniref:nucleotide 5'-monophosphate nucleosidase PpnN n=1 Tax=Motiliproteus sp. MSK22-1 TaxID=1897630 RepID=UPI0009786D12|nr:nucleotide 5'-monophosphate nucleosidase PpnN [Motiliproteus sp. MSK22-1]OMH39727.1 LOG family protein [Motiliproteus sp. MSK22-1]